MSDRSCSYVLSGCGLSCFGQFNLLQVHSSAPDDLVTIPKPNPSTCNGVSSIHYCMAQINTDTIGSVRVEASLVWDAALFHIKIGTQSVTLVSSKWASELSNSSNAIEKVWETRDGLLIRYVDGSVALKLKSGSTLIPVSANIEQYCSLTGGVAYVRLTDARFCQCVLHPLRLTPLLPSHPVKEIAGGTDHIVILAKDGCVYTFGLGTRGQLGHGDLVSRESPCLMEPLAGIRVTSVKCGNWHSLFLTEYGDVYSCGMNDNKQLGHSENEAICPLPRVVTVVDNEGVNFIHIGCGSRHSAGCTEDGVLHVWGWDEYGQVFDGKMTNIKYLTCGPWCTVYLN